MATEEEEEDEDGIEKGRKKKMSSRFLVGSNMQGVWGKH